MTAVYIAPEVAEVLALHPYLGDAGFRSAPIRDQIATQAERLHEAHGQGDVRVRMHIMCWWPEAQGRSVEEVLAGAFTASDARLTMSREYGFDSWDAVAALGTLTPDPVFEAALDHMLSGDGDALAKTLTERPDLVTARSRYGHGAMLLHYIAANGVESHRQQVPLNAAEIAELLVSNGADRTAEARMYGGGQTPLALAQTSAHPYQAGIADALNAALGVDP